MNPYLVYVVASLIVGSALGFAGGVFYTTAKFLKSETAQK